MANEAANREESEKCLRLSRDALSRGDRESAIKFAQKSLRLYESADNKAWLRQLESSRGSSDTSSNQTAGHYTPEQIKEVKEFLKIDKNDFYAVLRVKKGTEGEEIKRAYKKMALRFHPDKNQAPGADEAFKIVGTAFATLSDPEKRRRYDMFGSAEGPNPLFNSSANHRFSHSHGQQTAFSDIPMEDIMNMFFNVFSEDASPFNQSGMFFYQFPQFPQFAAARQRASRKHTHHQQHRFHEEYERRRRERRGEDNNQNVNTELITRLIQLVPLLLIVFLSFLSNLLFPPSQE